MRSAISCSIIKTEHNAPGDFLYSDYTLFFQKRGIKLIPISNSCGEPESYFDSFGLEGLILSGGNDLNSAQERDKQEKRLMDIAIRRNLPVLGICRGMQFINYYFKGRLPLEIKTAHLPLKEHVNLIHSVKIINSGFARLIGRERVKTNSFHKQGLISDFVSDELEVLAVSEDDGLVEALGHKKFPVMGIQWHPERQSPDDALNDAIIESFKERTFYRGLKR